MKQNRLRNKALACLLVAASATASAIDLPVKSVNGRRYYYYEVRQGDTVYSLAGRLGISRDDIIRYNPGAADGLRAGTSLYFPFEDFAEKGAATINHEVKRGETLFGLAHRYGITPDDIIALNPHTVNGLKSGETIMIPAGETVEVSAAQPASSPNETPLYVVEEKPVTPVEEETPAPAENALPPIEEITDEPAAETATENEPAEAVEASIAVVLPFGTGTENLSKQAQLYTDFYKGVLLAADSLSNTDSDVHISIYAFDNSNFALNDTLRNAAVVIAPEDAAQMAALAAAASESETYVLNIFNLKDEDYLTNESLVQANIPHQAMYAKAYEGMRGRFGETRPVILRNNNGRNEKEAFTEYIREKYVADGIVPVEIAYNGTLRSSDLDILDPAERYVAVPSSGSLTEFNKMSHALKAFRNDPATASIEIFGYPDWTAFRNDALDMLHTLGATIYTRVFIDPEGIASRNLAAGFTANYGAAPMEVVPNQGALGFDVAAMIIDNLRANEGVFTPDGSLWRGIQSAFRFKKSGENGGYVNDALYIVTFGNGKDINTTVL